MFQLTTENSFDAAHFLSGYDGKCGNIHGHRWRVLVDVCGEKLKEDGQMRGMLVDFSDVKKDVKEITDAFDHSFIYEVGSFRQSFQCLFSQGTNFIVLSMKLVPCEKRHWKLCRKKDF